MTATASRPRTGVFGQDFYPTPPDVAADMLDPLDLRGKVVLEPSAGKGDLVLACLERGAAEVLTCEIAPDLQQILRGIPKTYPVGADFLQLRPEQVSHVDVVTLNPPFSADEQHILHSWEIAPAGAHVVALCNWETVANDRWRRRRELGALIEGYGSSVNLGAVFAAAERPTEVEVGLVRLQKPGGPAADEFDGFYLGADDIEAQGHGLIPYRRSRDIVNRYVEACRIYDQQLEAGTRLQGVLDGLFGKTLGLQITMEGAPVARNRFRKELQKSAWGHVFAEFLPQQLATSQLSRDINAFVERQSQIPFTERNIYRMLQIVAATQEQRIDRAVEEVIEKLTRHSKDNRWNVEGWATNSAYMLNKKMIFPYMAELGWSGGVSIRTYQSDYADLQDLIKALCWLTGRDYEEVRHPAAGLSVAFASGEWRDWGFFEFKAYKKGTVHLRFKDRDDWAVINRRYARIKGLTLPERI